MLVFFCVLKVKLIHADVSVSKKIFRVSNACTRRCDLLSDPSQVDGVVLNTLRTPCGEHRMLTGLISLLLCH